MTGQGRGEMSRPGNKKLHLIVAWCNYFFVRRIFIFNILTS